MQRLLNSVYIYFNISCSFTKISIPYSHMSYIKIVYINEFMIIYIRLIIHSACIPLN